MESNNEIKRKNKLVIEMIDVVLMILKRIVRQKIPIEQIIIDMEKTKKKFMKCNSL